MVRKMTFVGISYITGLFFASFFSVKSNLLFSIAFIIITILYVFCFKNKRKEFMVIAITFIIAILMNVAYTKIVYENITKYNNQKITFEGEITDIVVKNNDKALYTIKGKINGKESTTLKLYTDSTKAGYYDKIIFEGTVKALEDTISFPSESYNKPKGIFLEVDKINSIAIYKNNNYPIQKYILDYRDYIYEKITSILPGDEGDFLGALLCGDTSGITKDVNSALFRAGIGHIISVSGSHLMIISGLILLLLMRLKVNRFARFFILELIMFLFIVFSGLSVSAVRAAIMFTILMLGTIAKRRADTLNSLGIAGLILTITTPYAIRDASLLLSLSGVFGLAVFAPWVIKTINFKGHFVSLKKAFITMVCVTIATFPFVAFFFDEVSIISPITNILLEPLCSVALICALIVAFFGGISIISYPLLSIAGVCLKAVIFISKFLIKIPFSYLPLGYSFIILTIVLCLIGILIITYIFRTKKALISSILSSIMIMLISVLIFQTSSENKLKISILSQNNSTAIILYKNSHAGIIDLSGKGEISGVIDKFFNKKGIKDVSFLTLCQNPQSAVSSYMNSISRKINNTMYSSAESNVLLNEKIYIDTINGDDTIVFNDTLIDFDDSDNVEISNGNFSLKCQSGNDDGKITFTLCVKTGGVETDKQILEINNSTNGSAYLIEVLNNGNYNIRGMDYALRE